MANVRSLFHLGEYHWHRNVQAAPQKNVIISEAYKLFTKMAQSRGPENIVPERPPPPLPTPKPVLSPTGITLDNNGKLRPQPDRENAFAGASGGERVRITGFQRLP